MTMSDNFETTHQGLGDERRRGTVGHVLHTSAIKIIGSQPSLVAKLNFMRDSFIVLQTETADVADQDSLYLLRLVMTAAAKQLGSAAVES